MLPGVLTFALTLMTADVWSPPQAVTARFRPGQSLWPWTDSQHFEIHYLPALAHEVDRVIRSGERAFDHVSGRLDFVFAKKVPLIMSGPTGPLTREEIVAYAISDDVAPQRPHRTRMVLPLPESDADRRHLIGFEEPAPSVALLQDRHVRTLHEPASPRGKPQGSTQRSEFSRHPATYLLEKAPTDAHMEYRGLNDLDAAFHLHACDRYTHGVADLRRLPDQTHRARLRLLLPLKLHGLQARPFSPSFEFHGSQQVPTRRPILIVRNVPDLEACVALKQIDAGNA